MTRLAPHEAKTACRSCGSPDLTDVFGFGETPIADRMMRSDDQAEEFRAPLTLAHCTACGLCQIRETVAPRVLFGSDYPYYSSVSPSLMAHFGASAQAIISEMELGSEDLVIEAASNDGYMLSAFKEAGVPVLGIDPADGPVASAREKGIETIHEFFSADLAKKLEGEGRRARVFLANNVLAHVEDVNDFVAGIGTLLAPDGRAVIEVPYLLDLLDTGAFDTIYHQHLLYPSVTALVPLFERHGLVLNDVARTWIHGGSLRLTIGRSTTRTARLNALLAEEASREIASPVVYQRFVKNIEKRRAEIRARIDAYKAEGKTVAGYGAAAKATTLMHVFGIDTDDLSCIADRSTWKQGLEMPVNRIPVVSPEELLSRAPDVVLMLAWNFADEIIAENRAYLEAGGRFLVPIPEVREVTRENLGVAA